MTKQQFLKEWSDKFFASPVRQMTHSEAELFIAITMNQRSGKNKQVPAEVAEHISYKIIEQRAGYVGLKIDPWAIVWLMHLSKSPGECVMWVYALRCRKQEVKFEDFTDWFPFGFPTDAALRDCWEAQKGSFNDDSGIRSDNRLDVCNRGDFE